MRAGVRGGVGGGLKRVDAGRRVVAASEGRLPQTRFVLGKALEAGIEVMGCINKIDRPDARAEEVLSEVYDLFIDLDADDKQIEFPVLYAVAREGYCHETCKLEPGNLKPLFDAIVKHIPPPKGRPENTLQVLVTQLDYDNYLGRIAIGRVVNGTLRRNMDATLASVDGQKKIRVAQLYGFEGLKRVETDTVCTGEICAIAGIEELDIGDTITDLLDPKPLPRVKVEEPTIGLMFLANTSPLAVQSAHYLTARHIR